LDGASGHLDAAEDMMFRNFRTSARQVFDE